MSVLELISFDICPFVQRSVITLESKKIPFKITYIDLAAKPDWFLTISPFGKVPVLRVGQEVLFESAVINEYLDETHGPQMHPQDPMKKAQNRAWIEFGSSLLMTMHLFFAAEDRENWDLRLHEIVERLARLEATLGEGPFFNGDQLALIDTAYAPAFMRLDLLKRRLNTSFLKQFPRVAAWSLALLTLDAVKNSVVSDFEQRFLEFYSNKKGYLHQLLGQEVQTAVS